MFKNYLKIALRSLFKNKIFSLINIFGLSVGMAGSLLILVYVFNELGYESMHEKKDNIYKIAIEFGSGNSAMKMAGVMPALSEAVLNEVPEIKDAARIKLMDEASVKFEETEGKEKKIFFTDPSFFNIFTLKILKGNPAKDFNEPFKIMLSASAANKYFGSVEPVEKTLIISQTHSFKVAGIFDDMESNTSLKTDFIASYKSIERINPPAHQWGSFGEDHTYLFANSSVDIADLQKKVQQTLIKNTNEQFAQMFNIIVIPFNEIYFHSGLMGDLGSKGNKDYVYLFSGISFLVLLIACLNFINLSTAKSLKRAKEVGVRKVLGANRRSLIKQFLSESLLITLAAAGLSLILFEYLSPLLNSFLNSQLNTVHLKAAQFYLIFFSIIVFVGVAAGAYPAFYLSKFNPVTVMRSKASTGKMKLGFRRILVVFQFGITIILIFCTLIIKEQVDYMQEGDLGFSKENILMISLPAGKENSETQYESLKNNLLKKPFIEEVAAAYTFPGVTSNEQQTVRTPGMADNENIVMRSIGVDYNYVKALGIKITEGRNFSKDFSTDKDEAVMLNNSAVNKLGIKNPVGKELMIPGGKDSGFRSVKIIGVVNDFHVQSMHQQIDPVFFYINPKRFYHAAIKFSGENSEQAVSYVQEEYARIFPAEEFSYSFLDDLYKSLYTSEEKINSIFIIFSLFGIFIASLGLAGLSAFSAEQRTKEICVRKILGATVAVIIAMLSKDYLKLVIIASVIAFPAAYFIAEKWLEDFAYRISIGFTPFAAAFLFSFVIAMATIFFRALKAATANPVKSLRYE